MKTKKWISMIAATAMMMGMLAGCGNTDSTSDRGTDTLAEAQEESAETSQKAEDAAETEESQTETTGNLAGTDADAESGNAGSEAIQAGKTLVVYYSASGHTENVANVIADAAGADLFALEPVEPYTSDDLNYSNDSSRVSKEHENEDQRDVELVSVAVEDWDSYETVLIGYPIWWGIAAWPVDSFVKENDFTGKTVIPFCTSASSGLGESGELLAEMAGTGEWQEGIRFSSSVSEEDVRSWVSGLGLGQ